MTTRTAIVGTLARLLRPFHFRGKGTLLNRLCPRDVEAEAIVYGYDVQLDLSDHIQRNIFLCTDHVEEKAILTSVLRPGMTFLDVGANIGFYSLLASSIVGPSGRVLAFEPNPKVFSRLKKTIDTNRIMNITALNTGLGSVSGTFKLFPNVEPNNATATMVADSQSISIDVPVQTIDGVVEKMGISRIDYMKIDVDGFEPNVIAGAKKTLQSGRIRYIQSEFSERWLRLNGSSCDTLYDTYLNFGFDELQSRPEFPKNCIKDCFFRFHERRR